MKGKFLPLLAAAALMMGVTSCNNDDDAINGGVVAEGKPTYMELNVSFQTPGTYAEADDNATLDETTVKSVSVFIFDKNSGVLVSKGSLAPGDFTQSASGQKDVYTAKTKIATTTGDKYVYVGVNLPTVLDLNLGATINQLKTGVVTTSANTLASTTDGFAMFSTEDKQASLVETSATDYLTKNTVSVSVERLTAKVTVQAAAGLSLSSGNGVLSNLQFAIRQSNTQMFRYKYVDGIVVKDPNWDTYVSTDFENFTDYVAINASSITDVKQLVAKYAAENTSKAHLEKEVTYASIRATFVPNQFHNETENSNVGQAAQTFYVVSTNDGLKEYFKTEAAADAYVTAKAALAPVKSAPYVDGVCYYNMFLNPKGGYNAIRNSFYKATITQILAPGNPSADPKDPEQPVETATNITVHFEVLPWTLVEDNYILK